MAAWRTKAFDLFGFKAGDYSFAHGKITLFADLVVMARRAGAEDDCRLLDRITKYVCWAAAQSSHQLSSAVDLAFFLPMFRDPKLLDLFQGRLPDELLAEKSRQLFGESDEPIS